MEELKEKLTSSSARVEYRGRIAPSPTGYLHLGHARTFWTAYERARARGGTLVLRMEDSDPRRSRAEFASAAIEDLRWLGIEWREGPDVGGAFGPYAQSRRRTFYAEAWERLRALGLVYPCACTRRDIALAGQAPHDEQHGGDDEPVYPGTCRTRAYVSSASGPRGANWRFRVNDGEEVVFEDLKQGRQTFVAGRDFGDFVVWSREDVTAYQLAVVVDDALMKITEVVRGADLLKSTARQILLQRALSYPAPEYFHCPLVTDERGRRLAKRHDALSLRSLRASGVGAEELRARFRADEC